YTSHPRPPRSPLFPYTTLFRSERPSSMKAAMAAPAAAPATQRFRWDALQVALLVVLFLQVWRIQLLVRGLPLFGLPILATAAARSEEHTSELQSRFDLVCRFLL